MVSKQRQLFYVAKWAQIGYKTETAFFMLQNGHKKVSKQRQLIFFVAKWTQISFKTETTFWELLLNTGTTSKYVKVV